jgi:hypothetical protein
MDLPPYFSELLLEPADPLFAEPLTCACCGGTTQTAFGYVGSSVPGAEEKPAVYIADWMPTHAQYGITVVVAQGELHEDEATNMRAMAFPFQSRPGGGANLTLINAEDTRFAKALSPVSLRCRNGWGTRTSPQVNAPAPGTFGYTSSACTDQKSDNP